MLDACLQEAAKGAAGVAAQIKETEILIVQ